MKIYEMSLKVAIHLGYLHQGKEIKTCMLVKMKRCAKYSTSNINRSIKVTNGDAIALDKSRTSLINERKKRLTIKAIATLTKAIGSFSVRYLKVEPGIYQDIQMLQLNAVSIMEANQYCKAQKG